MALCHLLSHYIATGDDRLGSVCVVEEVPVGEGVCRCTREQGRPTVCVLLSLQVS